MVSGGWKVAGASLSSWLCPASSHILPLVALYWRPCQREVVTFCYKILPHSALPLISIGQYRSRVSAITQYWASKPNATDWYSPLFFYLLIYHIWRKKISLADLKKVWSSKKWKTTIPAASQNQSQTSKPRYRTYCFTPIKLRLGLGPRKNAIKVFLSRIVIDKCSIFWFCVFL